ncbi:MAG: hypothetical protein ACI8RZ_000803 [Myxococcota bacterium]|jgi:hypothetical protein
MLSLLTILSLNAHAGDKVDICHNGSVINISENALDAHGDTYPQTDGSTGELICGDTDSSNVEVSAGALQHLRAR